MTRKRRTREHIIEDLSHNHVERQVLLCGWSTQHNAPDYGIDMTIHTYTTAGEIENGYISLQLKGTDRLRVTAVGDEIIYSINASDLDHWLGELFPIVLVRYDAIHDVAYWLHIQEYFRDFSRFELAQLGKTIAVRIPMANVLNKEAVRELARRRDAVLRRYRG